MFRISGLATLCSGFTIKRYCLKTHTAITNYGRTKRSDVTLAANPLLFSYKFVFMVQDFKFYLQYNTTLRVPDKNKDR